LYKTIAYLWATNLFRLVISTSGFSAKISAIKSQLFIHQPLPVSKKK